MDGEIEVIPPKTGETTGSIRVTLKPTGSTTPSADNKLVDVEFKAVSETNNKEVVLQTNPENDRAVQIYKTDGGTTPMQADEGYGVTIDPEGGAGKFTYEVKRASDNQTVTEVELGELYYIDVSLSDLKGGKLSSAEMSFQYGGDKVVITDANGKSIKANQAVVNKSGLTLSSTSDADGVVKVKLTGSTSGTSVNTTKAALFRAYFEGHYAGDVEARVIGYDLRATSSATASMKIDDTAKAGVKVKSVDERYTCLLYTSDAADEL